jgi:hypothetical protein
MAIVLGVATIAAAFTLTDTMGRAADDLSVGLRRHRRRRHRASPFTSTNDNENLTQPTIDAKDDRPRARGPRRRAGGRRHHRPRDQDPGQGRQGRPAAARGSASACTCVAAHDASSRPSA